MGDAVVVEGLTRDFGNVHALRGIDLTVESGTILGVLGPNGAGKTTAVRILTTLLRPTSGRVEVLGHDVVHEAQQVRELIGLTGQATAVVDELTGSENLQMMARLHHLSKAEARQRAAELLEQFDLVDAADRVAKTYSGGMRRRLDLAASLVGRPKVLFLDEPTTGLDPRGRLGMWAVIRDLVSAGTTLVLTTQYLEEADELADAIVVIDRGQIIARGTADELKDRVGGDVIEFETASDAAAGEAVRALDGVGETAAADGTTVTLRVGRGGGDAMVDVVRRLDAAHVEIRGLSLRRPSLDDVFLALTGHVAEEAQQ